MSRLLPKRSTGDQRGPDHVNGLWPHFAPVAVGGGYRSVHALPVRLRDQVIGALNLFRARPGRLDELDVRAAQAIADATAISILQQRALQEARLLADQLRAALDSRVLIEQAKGMLAERAKLTVSDAFVAMRRYARDHNERITGVARAIIDGTLSVADLV